MTSERCGVVTSTRSLDAFVSSCATLVSATRRPRPMTMRWSAVSSSSPIRWLETSTTRLCAASSRMRPRIHTIPSGSRPLTGSSNMSTGGSPSNAAAIPSRCRMPSERPPARRRDADARPTWSSTSFTRRFAMPLLWAIHSR